MERLTTKYMEYSVPKDACTINRLGEADDCMSCKEVCEECNETCDICCIQECLNKLADYEDAEEQGLLLRLPCKVGDKVWIITSTANYSLGEYREVPLKHPQEKKIQSITVTKNGLLYHVKDRTYAENDFGKTVFLTKEEAEQALKQMGE